ncbi:MAG: hypothetical protein VX403_11195, partial [Planctomycetota bacterium]|nr:hypothetical protein [Planctomycetota bacterium]
MKVPFGEVRSQKPAVVVGVAVEVNPPSSSSKLFVEDHYPIPTNMLDATFDIAPIDIDGDGYLDILQTTCEGFT